MNKFTLQILVFTFLCSILVCSILLIENFILKKNNYFKNPNMLEYAFLGHSHSECTYNDTIIVNSKNFSRSGEAYFYTYQKAKMILSTTPKINVIFIEFSNGDIAKSRDNWIWKNRYLDHRFEKYSSYMDIEDHFLLIRNNTTGYINNFFKTRKHNFSKIVKSQYNITSNLGRFRYLKRDKTDSLIIAKGKIPSEIVYTENVNAIRVKLREKSYAEISEENLNYLIKTIELFQNQGCKVFLVRSPQHIECEQYRNENLFQSILKDKLTSTEFLDFNNFPLQHSEFGDFGHLNFKGAKKYSEWFNELIKSGLLEKPNKQEYINNKILEKNKNYLEDGN